MIISYYFHTNSLPEYAHSIICNYFEMNKSLWLNEKLFITYNFANNDSILLKIA